MKVQSVNNTNYSPNFNAKIRIAGNINDLKLMTISNWVEKALTIGSEADTIILQFGKKESSFAKRLFGFIPLSNKKVDCRKIFALAQIKGKSYDENLSYYYKDKDFNEYNYIKKSVDKYLDKLSKAE